MLDRTDISFFTSVISLLKSRPLFQRLKYLCSLFCNPIMHLFSLFFLFFPTFIKNCLVQSFTISHHCAHVSYKSWRVCHWLNCSLYSLTTSSSSKREQFSFHSPPPTVTPVQEVPAAACSTMTYWIRSNTYWTLLRACAVVCFGDVVESW